MSAQDLPEDKKKELMDLLFKKDSPAAKKALLEAKDDEDRRLVIPVMYDEKMLADPGKTPSPSARKPKEVFERLLEINDDPKGRFFILLVGIDPLTPDDFKLAHNPTYVDNILALRSPNGFGTFSKSVVDSLPYTNGSMYSAAKFAFPTTPSCALSSGFHHAGYDGYHRFGYFCTLNGLMITTMKILKEEQDARVAIVDCDGHDGNGTRDILDRFRHSSRAEQSKYVDRIYHKSFGRIFSNRYHAKAYLEHFDLVRQDLESFKPTHILYQAGADAHVDDPSALDRELGGCLTTDQMYERDLRMFSIARDLKVPLAWNLAGGYQIDSAGSAKKVIDLHINTFNAAADVYWNSQGT